MGTREEKAGQESEKVRRKRRSGGEGEKLGAKWGGAEKKT